MMPLYYIQNQKSIFSILNFVHIRKALSKEG